jgi:hypothetical protein
MKGIRHAFMRAQSREMWLFPLTKFPAVVHQQMCKSRVSSICKTDCRVASIMQRLRLRNRFPPFHEHRAVDC